MSSSSRAVARIVWVCAVASVSVCERVIREKSSKRSRSVTVRQTRRAARSRRPILSTRPISVTSSDAGVFGRRPERVLRADRAPPPAPLHASRVAVVRERVQVPARRPAEHLDEHRLLEPCDLGDRGDPVAAKLLARDRPDAPEPLDRERVEEIELAVRRHHEQAVGLADRARDLREELRARHADGDRQADLLAHLAPQPLGDLGRPAGEVLHAADVEERLVDRQRLHDRRRPLEDLEHGLARLGIGRHSRRDHGAPAGRAAAPAARPSQSARHAAWPRSSPRAPPPRRR